MLQSARIVPLLLFVSVLIAGCNQNDLGRYCFVGSQTTDPEADMALTILNTEAPECGERLCLKQGGYRCTDPEMLCDLNPDDNKRLKINPMCTMECKKNADCEKSDENVNACRKYVCQEQGDETGFGEHCICVCLDFIRSAEHPIDLATFNDPNRDHNACGNR